MTVVRFQMFLSLWWRITDKSINVRYLGSYSFVNIKNGELNAVIKSDSSVHVHTILDQQNYQRTLNFAKNNVYLRAALNNVSKEYLEIIINNNSLKDFFTIQRPCQ